MKFTSVILCIIIMFMTICSGNVYFPTICFMVAESIYNQVAVDQCAFEELPVGEELFCNRDCYGLKINEWFWITIEHGEKYCYIYKVEDKCLVDFQTGADLYFEGVADKVYSSDDYIIVFSQKDSSYTMITCSNKKNNLTFNSENDLPISLSDYKEFDF